MEQTQNGRAPGSGWRLRNMVIFALATAVLAASCAWFAHSYNNLKRAIAEERASFVGETASQIVMSHRFIREEYVQTTVRLAGIAEHSNATTLAELALHYLETDRDNILLLGVAGGIVDLYGNNLFLTDRNKAQALRNDDNATELFASLNNGGDFWLFSAPMETITLDNAAYNGIVLAVPEGTYRSALATSLYHGHGAAYIIKNNGSIEVRPQADALPFGGYNLFVSMAQAGASREALEALQAEMESDSEGSFVIDIAGTDWLVNYFVFSGEDAVVVLVPLSITAAKTYDGLNFTILSAVCVILTVAAIGLFIFATYARRDRERAKAMMAVEAKSEFFSKMSHDIRTPLNAIVGLQTLAMDKNEDPVVADYLSQSATSTQYLLGIINDVLEMSRIESGKMTLSHNPFDMNTLLSDVKTLSATMAGNKGVHFATEIDGKFDREYIGDTVRLEQVLINILNNAVKFTDVDGSVTLRVTQRVVNERRDELTFAVADTGRGIGEAFLAHLFTPFDQERSSVTGGVQGSGLGLAIVHALVELMHGSIHVESKVDVGSTFTVKLPLEKGDGVSSVVVAPTKLVTFPGTRVLMAEDNAINQNIAVKLLKNKFDLDVTAVDDGKQAVDAFAASAPGDYALILMDIKMPVMDGLTAATAIRALDRPDAKSIPILALSANMYREDVELSHAAGMNDHLAKPMDINALSKAFQKYLL